MRTAWIKWARAVEHQRELAASGREFLGREAPSYVCTDNAGDATDPLIRMEWRINISQPYPERWSVLIGDVLTNLRAALDHTLWAAVELHSGPPANPHRIQFPITSKPKDLRKAAADVQALVAPPVWDIIEALQPLHGGAEAHTAPLEILRWMSNVDKHRAVHVMGMTSVDFGPIELDSPTPLEVVEQWQHHGQVTDGIVLARLAVKRPASRQTVDAHPTFAHTPTLQISDAPIEYRSLSSLMAAMNKAVLEVLTYITAAAGQSLPDMDSLELGDHHEALAPDNGGNIARLHRLDGTVLRVSLDRDPT
jgi:hypothetical protein